MSETTPTQQPGHASKEITRTKSAFSLWKVLLPVAIGLTVVVLMFMHDAKKEDLAQVWGSIHFTPHVLVFIFIAMCFMFGRDFGLSWRFRTLTDHKLSWLQAFKVDLLCEFTSCITPSAVGGSSLGFLFLNSQGIELGRATTLMMTTLFLDELFFVVACPIFLLFSPVDEVFQSAGIGFSHGIKFSFWLVYSAITVWTVILFIGIILKPEWIQRVLGKVFSIKWLRRWQSKAEALAGNMQATSAELRSKPFRFWLEVFGGTALSWISRYMVVNALFMGFLPDTLRDQWIILVKQLVIWVVLMICPTPGGSGLSEYLFSEYYGNIVTSAGLALILAIFWRLISYYVYLLIGCAIVPGWVKSTISKIRDSKEETPEATTDNHTDTCNEHPT